MKKESLFFVRIARTMKILMIAFVLVSCFSAHASLPEYYSSFQWVEKYCATNTPNLDRAITKDQRIYIMAADRSFARLEAYHQGMTLGDLIITSPDVIIMRPGYESPLIIALQHPDFKIESMDVIYLTNGCIL